MEAYEEMIQGTATKEAPWYVVPANNKWFTRVVVASAVAGDGLVRGHGKDAALDSGVAQIRCRDRHLDRHEAVVRGPEDVR